MTTHSSAIAHQDTPHETETTIITVSDATKRRAESVINDKTIDPQWRTIIRAALELNDPWLAELVTRAEAGENIVDTFESLRTPDAVEDDSTLGKIEALAEIISRSGGPPFRGRVDDSGRNALPRRSRALSQRRAHARRQDPVDRPT